MWTEARATNQQPIELVSTNKMAKFNNNAVLISTLLHTHPLAWCKTHLNEQPVKFFPNGITTIRRVIHTVAIWVSLKIASSSCRTTTNFQEFPSGIFHSSNHPIDRFSFGTISEFYAKTRPGENDARRKNKKKKKMEKTTKAKNARWSCCVSLPAVINNLLEKPILKSVSNRWVNSFHRQNKRRKSPKKMLS